MKINGISGKAGPSARIVKALALVALGLWALSAGSQAAQAKLDIREELRCLALTIYFEARGEPDLGKLAVGHVVMNRLAHPRFPQTICAVVRQGGENARNRCQFSWWCDGRNDTPKETRAWTMAKALARRIFWDYSVDPTAGALFYHADFVSPRWRHAFAKGPTIGRHIFYYEEPPFGDEKLAGLEGLQPKGDASPGLAGQLRPLKLRPTSLLRSSGDRPFPRTVQLGGL